MTMSAREVARLRKKREAERGGGGDKWLKALPEGDTFLRLGPPWSKHANFWKDRYFHGKFKEKVFCAKNDIDEDTGKERKCIVCRKAKKLKRGDPLWALIAQKSETLWNVVKGKFKEKHGDFIFRGLDTKKFQIWQVSYQPSQDLQDFFSEERYRKYSELGITDLKQGRWLRVHRRGQKKETKWKFELLDPSMVSESSSERHALEKTLIDLDDVVRGSSDEELEAFLEKMTKKAKEKSSSSASGSSSGSEDKKKSSSSGSASSSSEDKKKKSSEDKKKKSSSGSSSGSADKKGSGSSSSGDDNKKAKEVYKEMKDSMDKGKKSKKEKGSADKKESKKESKKSSSSGSASSSSSEDKKDSGSSSSSGS